MSGGARIDSKTCCSSAMFTHPAQKSLRLCIFCRHASVVPKGGPALRPDKTPSEANADETVVAACAILILITIISAMSVGWLLAHAVETSIGNPSADLKAEAVTFASDSGATVHGWRCRIQNANR